MKQHDNLYLSLIINYNRFQNLSFEDFYTLYEMLHIYSFFNICLQENSDKF